jgi:hypothetical protein
MMTGGAWQPDTVVLGSGVALGLPDHQTADRRVDRFSGRKHLVVEIHHVELDCDEFEFAVLRNGNANRLTGIFDDMFAHDNNSLPPASRAGAN